MNSVERAAPEPSQGGSSLEAKLDEQDRLNVPRLLLNDGHSLPQLGFGVWQIDNADAPEPFCLLRLHVQHTARLYCACRRRIPAGVECQPVTRVRLHPTVGAPRPPPQFALA